MGTVLNNDFWLSQYRWYIYYFQPRRMKYIYFILLIQQFYKFRGNQNILVPLPETFTFYKDNLAQTMSSNHKRKRSQSQTVKYNEEMKEEDIPLTMEEIMLRLSFDLQNMNPETQKKLNIVEYAQFIYYHFVHRTAKHKIQFSDKSIVKYIEQSLFENTKLSERQRRFFDSDDYINVKIYDKMWNAVFRYLHQMTYEPFVI